MNNNDLHNVSLRREIQETTRKEAAKQRIIDKRRNIRRVYGDYSYIELTEDEIPRVRAYVRMALGKPSHTSEAGGMRWDEHGIMLTNMPNAQITSHTKLSEYGKQIMDNIWQIVESYNK